MSAPYDWLRYTQFAERFMSTAVKAVSIQTFVEGLRQLPEAAFDRTETVRRFLEDTPAKYGKSVRH